MLAVIKKFSSLLVKFGALIQLGRQSVNNNTRRRSLYLGEQWLPNKYQKCPELQ